MSGQKSGHIFSIINLNDGRSWDIKIVPHLSKYVKFATQLTVFVLIQSFWQTGK